MKHLLALYEAGINVVISNDDKLKLLARRGIIRSEHANAVRENKADIIKQLRTTIAGFMIRTTSVTSLDELEACLSEFSLQSWTLVERSMLSNAYTPIALRLIALEEAPKYQTLERLALLCWRSSSNA